MHKCKHTHARTHTHYVCTVPMIKILTKVREFTQCIVGASMAPALLKPCKHVTSPAWLSQCVQEARNNQIAWQFKQHILNRCMPSNAMNSCLKVSSCNNWIPPTHNNVHWFRHNKILQICNERTCTGTPISSVFTASVRPYTLPTSLHTHHENIHLPTLTTQ
jgi:hypothetical protein